MMAAGVGGSSSRQPVRV